MSVTTPAPTAPLEPLVSTLARQYAVDVELVTNVTAGPQTSATAVAATDVLSTPANHGWANGTAIRVISGPAPLVANQVYFARDVAGRDLKLAVTAGGVPVDISVDGPASLARAAVSSSAWVPVRGMVELKPKIDSELKDDSDYDSDGWGSQTKTGMKWSLEMKVARKRGVTTKALDPGQEKLRLAADEFGVDGSVSVRWYDRNGGPEAYGGVGTVSYSPEGGNYDDLNMSAITVTGQGKRNKITNPVAVAV